MICQTAKNRLLHLQSLTYETGMCGQCQTLARPQPATIKNNAINVQNECVKENVRLFGDSVQNVSLSKDGALTRT